MRSSSTREPGGRRGEGVRRRAACWRIVAAWLCLTAVCDAGAPGLADTLAEDRIARCQDLVHRQASLAVFIPATWRVWDDPVPKSALPAPALKKIKARDLLYDGGIGGVFRTQATNASGQAREVFAYCSYDNLFVWLQGFYDGGIWTQFSSTDYIVPY